MKRFPAGELFAAVLQPMLCNGTIHACAVVVPASRPAADAAVRAALAAPAAVRPATPAACRCRTSDVTTWG
jgi:hypothetical protein